MLCYSTDKKINGKIKREKYNTSFRVIRRFIRVAFHYGYEVSISNKHKGSCYVDFCKKGSSIIDFKFRFSDHFLGKNNQIPAGVINEYTTLDYCIRDIQIYCSIYNKMNVREEDELWTNRYNYD